MTACRGLGFIILMVAAACEQAPEPKPAGIYLTQVIYHQNADQIRHYSYHSNGKLAVREFEFLDRIVEKFDYAYSGDQLQQVEYWSIKNHQDLTLYLLNTLQFHYSSDVMASTNLIPDNLTIHYNYDPAGRLVEWYSDGQRKVFSYNMDGNIEKVESFTEDVLATTLMYYYDNFRNPFLRWTLCTIRDQVWMYYIFFSPNNLLKCIALDENQDTLYVREFIYHYNTADYPEESFELYTSRINDYDRDTASHILFKYGSFPE